jgi:hypothetical protein
MRFILFILPFIFYKNKVIRSFNPSAVLRNEEYGKRGLIPRIVISPHEHTGGLV